MQLSRSEGLGQALPSSIRLARQLLLQSRQFGPLGLQSSSSREAMAGLAASRNSLADSRNALAGEPPYHLVAINSRFQN
jgi:hypothetical protein